MILLPQSAYIRLKDRKEPLTWDELQDELKRYIEITSKTGEQLDWEYEKAAFPYTIAARSDKAKRWFYLKGADPALYKVILIGLGEDEEGTSVVQITLPDISTHGDKGKANELCRYLAKRLKGDLILFNGRVQSFA